MKFGLVHVQDATDTLLAHSVRAGARIFKKGHRLNDEDVAFLRAAGIETVTVVRLGASDVPEDEAAGRIAAKLAGENVRIGAAFTGRVNLFAKVDGILTLAAACIGAINAVDESITVATLTPFARVSQRQMIGTVKIIPFAAEAKFVERIESILEKAAVAVAPFRRRKVALILTTLAGTRPALLDKTRAAIRARVEGVGSSIVAERDAPHAVGSLSNALRDFAYTSDLILVSGASAITDRRDVIPASIEHAGGKVKRFGMPVDPGNLLLVGRIGGADVIGLPGCARSPKLNGFDFILWRLAAGLEVSSKDVAQMGVGGLLMEIPTRPQPRDEPAALAVRRVGAIVLAAGASSRMGSNKLLVDIHGKPMIRRVVEAATASSAEPVIVVTGNSADAVTAALAGCDVQFVHNPDFAQGLSTSLKRGLIALPEDCDGAVIVLGDMPEVRPALIDKLLAAFDPAEDRAICVATRGGKRGNPVLFARRFFAEMESIEGDLGARGLIGAYPELVCEVEAGNDSPLIDIDTAGDLAGYRRLLP